MAKCIQLPWGWSSQVMDWRGYEFVDVANSWRPSIDGPDIKSDRRLLILMQLPVEMDGEEEDVPVP